jgi:hypothetical protein
MADNNRARLQSFSHLSKVLPALFLVGAAVLQFLSPSGSCAVCGTVGSTIQDSRNDPNVELTRARERANSTQKSYETIKRLSETGSASQRELRRSDLQRKVALLDYSSLLNPGRREKNHLLKAEVILQFRSEELAVIKELYRRGSVSKLTYLRSVAARDIAESNLSAAKSATQTQRQMQAINAARSKLELAQKEHQIATRLFQSNAISQPTLDRATSNLKIASAELEASKQALGARAVQVKQ